MSKLLQQAIERVRELPEEEQDMAAAELIGYLRLSQPLATGTSMAMGRT